MRGRERSPPGVCSWTTRIAAGGDSQDAAHRPGHVHRREAIPARAVAQPTKLVIAEHLTPPPDVSAQV